MSEAQQEKLADGWEQPIGEERRLELQRNLDRWAAETEHNERKGPFADVPLTGADVSWLAERSGRGPVGSTPNLHLEGANLREAHLERFNLVKAHLEGAHLFGAHLEGASLADAHLEGAHLDYAQMGGGALLFEAHLEGASLRYAHLEGANLGGARLGGANLGGARLGGANLADAHLEGANLDYAQMEGVELADAHLEGASLADAHLEGASLLRAHLEGADLRRAFFDSATTFSSATWVRKSHAPTGPWLADVHWGSANLTVVEWERIQTVQDEREAEDLRYKGTKAMKLLKDRRDVVDRRKSKRLMKRVLRGTRVSGYLAAGRAYRLLFVALRNQGLATPATRYHYRAELMDRKALWHRRRFVHWIFSWLLGTFAGYGDYIGRLFVTYAAVIVAFAMAMFATSARVPSPDSIGDVLILSVTSFHGRGV
jgi:uncharacterized protein YjbI with pentapeptide repeats